MADKTAKELAAAAQARQAQQYIDALHRERDGYLSTGRPARANNVAAELRRIGEKCEDVEIPTDEPTEPQSPTRTATTGGGRTRR